MVLPDLSYFNRPSDGDSVVYDRDKASGQLLPAVYADGDSHAFYSLISIEAALVVKLFVDESADR